MKDYINISEHTTFGVPAWVKAIQPFRSLEELNACIPTDLNTSEIMILGGGSNVLFTKPFDGLVLKNELKGIEVIEENETSVILKVAAGELWHDFVQFAVKNNWGGIENLALIPGSVGASPMQNIGAYGVEIKDVFQELEAFEISTKTLQIFDKVACQFGYRESVFKRALKNKFIITSVTYCLSKQPEINTSYGAINEELKTMGIEHPTVKDVSEAVIRIRQSKLPNPKEIGNAGSFFKNPVVPKEILTFVQSKYPEVPFYPIAENSVKIPAGWLIEKAGWKGVKQGEIGVHKNQALVLVNYGEGEGKDIVRLSNDIIKSIEETFQITLEREVNIL